jgi:hypothetical protein
VRCGLAVGTTEDEGEHGEGELEGAARVESRLGKVCCWGWRGAAKHGLEAVELDLGEEHAVEGDEPVGGARVGC